MQLNYDRIDHITLYRGGGYIIEDGNMLKTFAIHFTSRVHKMVVTSRHPQNPIT